MLNKVIVTSVTLNIRDTDQAELIRCLAETSAQWNLEDGDAVIANGSRFEGLGNEQSDVDAWVIMSDRPQARSVPVFDWQRGLHLNMSSYTYEMVEVLAIKMNAIAAADDYGAIAAIPINTLDRYYRVCSAVPVINYDAVIRIQSTFSLAHLTELLIAWSGVRCSLELDKARTALAAGRSDHALLCSRRAAESAIDHVLARNGEVYPSLKWRFEKLARCFGENSATYAEAWSIKAPGSRAPAEYLTAVEAYAAKTGASDYPAVPSLLRRAPSTELFDLGGRSYLVQGKAVLFELNPTARWLWEHLDGTCAEADLLTDVCQAFHLTPVARRGAVRFLTTLVDSGLATYTTDTLF